MENILYYEILIILNAIKLLGGLLLVYIISYLSILLYNAIGRFWKPIWITIEYMYYRKEFKEYFKDKKSITKKFNK